MGFSETRARLFPEAVPLDRFLTRSRRLLRPHGFTDRNSLALLGACRDELSMGAVLAVRRHWGAPFLLTSSAGLPTYGRSALVTAAQHAPDRGDGVRRLVVILTTHLGIDRSGRVGQVQRPGQQAPTPACGALAGWRSHPGFSRGHRIASDTEMQLLTDRLNPEFPTGAVPELAELAVTCRRVINTDFVAMAGELLREPHSLTAVFSGLLVHGPNGDYLDPGPATLYQPGAGPVEL